ncbi:hypothetical protein PSHT_04167 [Puccinia striiformis]|uniref:Uncharacterized protein n=1 Tax=Puccinia striiformis TaxID=27350 RepID=A0A2S4WDX7_9BASI|nr:hypothetical protein PSHT_04167 [Puccinia striiformis]
MVAGRRSAGSATQGTPTRNMGSGNSTDQSLNPQRSSRVTTPLCPPNQSKQQHSGHQKTKEGNLQTLASASTQHDIAATTDSLALQGQTEAYDYNQDSEVEIENIESKLRTKKGNEADKDDNFSYVEDCFEPPFWKSGDLPGTALNFNCKWCRMTLTGFVPTKRFECWVLNQILVIWQVRRALPCSRIEDPKLRAAFLYSNKDACLYSQRWSTNETKQLYAGLRQQVNQLEDIYEELEAEEAYESDYGNADDEELSHESESEGHPDNDAFEPENSIHPTSQSVPAHSGGSKHIKSAKLRDLTTQVIDQILKDNQESVEKSWRKSRGRTNTSNPTNVSQFDNITFFARKWQDIQELNWELEKWKVIILLGRMSSRNTWSSRRTWQEKLNAAHKSDALYPMYCAMTKQVSKYRDKAMACDTLVHPCFQITLFILVFGQDSLEVAQCNNLIQREFARIKETISSKAAEHLNPIPATQKKQATSKHELQLFLTANLTFKCEDIADQNFALQWWKGDPPSYQTTSRQQPIFDNTAMGPTTGDAFNLAVPVGGEPLLLAANCRQKSVK